MKKLFIAIFCASFSFLSAVNVKQVMVKLRNIRDNTESSKLRKTVATRWLEKLRKIKTNKGQERAILSDDGVKALGQRGLAVLPKSIS